MKTILLQSLINSVLFITLSLTILTLPYTKANTITDLDSTTWGGFTAQAANWATSGVNGGDKVGYCWSNYILGGAGVLSSPTGWFSRTFSGLSTPHNTVYFTMYAYQIDSWDGGENFVVNLAGNILNGWAFDRPAPWAQQSCGGSWAEIPPVLIRATVPHTGSTFYISVTSQFDQGSSDESFGFREITLTTDTLPSTPGFSYCGVTAGNPLAYAWCGCTSHQYMAYPQSGCCIECSNNCQTCAWGAPATCTTCYPGWYMVGTTCYPTCTYPLYYQDVNVAGIGTVRYCRTPCLGQYAYWDATCGATCEHSNLYNGNTNYYPAIYPETESTFLKCMYPCATTEFLSWNNTCRTTCPDPLEIDVFKSRNFCAYPCAATEFLGWNKSCLATCPYPLSPETQGTYLPKKYCWYTCDPADFLFYNQSCINKCPYPLSPEVQGTFRQRNFCWYPCMPWQWLNWDQTCHDNCVSPLWPEIHGNPARQFCWYPCTSEAKFLYWNTSCLPECPKPLSTRYENGQWFCDYPCTSTQYLYWNGSCINNCILPLLSKTEGNPLRNYCYYPCPVDKFAYWDNTCQSSCDFPLVPNSEGNPIRQFCWYLCFPGEYLYWNGSCINKCDFPLNLPRTTNDRVFCDYPCLENEYLFWNKSCLASCPYPLSTRVEGVTMKRNFCDFLCDPSKYLYWNGSCHDTCDFPLSIRLEGDATFPRKFCDYPCNGNQFLYWNGSCMNKCELPLIIRIDVDKKFCDYLCPPTHSIYWDGACDPSCNPPLISYSQGSPSRKYCKYPCQKGQFLYPNGTCFDACQFPLTSSVVHSQLLCHYPCSLTTQFLYWNGSCIAQCDFPLSQRIENSNSWKYCDYPCSDSNYLYWNGSCLPSCQFPLTPRVTDNNLYCDFTCATTTDHLYWNGTCDANCPFPLTSTQQGSPMIRNFCASQCPTQYLYWNGSCISQCNFPLSTRINNGTHFCDYPCLNTEFLYWNASCANDCLFPLSTRIDAGDNYCDKPCKYDEEYVFWNGTCYALCDFPLRTRNESSMLYCDYPCDPITELLFFTGTCVSTCTIPHKIRTQGNSMPRNFCVHNCSTDEYLYWNGSCREVCQSPRRTIYNNSIRYCEKPCENPTDYYHETLKGCKPTCDDSSYPFFNVDYLSCRTPGYAYDITEPFSNFNFFLYAPLKENTPTVVSLVKSMQYVRYIDINMPPRLERLAKSKGRNIMSIKSGINMWDGLKTHFLQQAIPDAYIKLSLHSSFLVNYWEDLSMIIIGVFLALFFLCFERLARALDFQKAEVIFHTLSVLTRWNFVIMMIAINIDDVILYSALQIKSWNPADTDNSSTTISFALSIVAIFAMLGFFTGLCYLASQLKPAGIKSISKQISSHVPTTQAEESYQIIFRGFKNSPGARFFFPFYIIRIALPSVITIAAESIPILNTVMQLTLSIIVLGFIVYVKPFTKRINFIQLAIFESIILLMNFLMVVITLISINDKENYKMAIFLSDLVILGNDIINIMSIIFMVIKLTIEIRQIREYKTKKIVPGNEVLGLWVQLLYIPLQQTNMGFEEMAAFPTKITQFSPHTKLPVEESEFSIKKNIAEARFTEGIMNETNRKFLQTEVHSLNEIKVSANETMSSPELFKNADSPLKKSPALTDDFMQSPEIFRLDPPTFDRNPVLELNLLENPSKHSQSSKKIVFQDQENNDFVVESPEIQYVSSPEIKTKDYGNEEKSGENERISEEETLDLENNNDDAMVQKIKKNLDTLNKHLDEQSKKEGKHAYLKKNEGVNSKKHQ